MWTNFSKKQNGYFNIGKASRHKWLQYDTQPIIKDTDPWSCITWTMIENNVLGWRDRMMTASETLLTNCSKYFSFRAGIPILGLKFTF